MLNASSKKGVESIDDLVLVRPGTGLQCLLLDFDKTLLPVLEKHYSCKFVNLNSPCQLNLILAVKSVLSFGALKFAQEVFVRFVRSNRQPLVFLKIIYQVLVDLSIWYPCRYLKPMFSFSMADNEPRYYRVAKLFGGSINVVQNGRRGSDIFDLGRYVKRYGLCYCDNVFCFSFASEQLLKQYLTGKYYHIGSVKNNEFLLGLRRNKRLAIYISSYRVKSDWDYKGISHSAHFGPERWMLPKIKAECNRRNLCLFVVGATEKASAEYSFYKEILGRDGWRFVKKRSSKTSYKWLSIAEYVFGISSTLLLEALAHKKRLGVLYAKNPEYWPRVFETESSELSFEELKYEFFGSPILDMEGPFWTSRCGTADISRIAELVLDASDDKWNEIYNATDYSKIMASDVGNKLLGETNLVNVRKYDSNI